MKKSYLSTIIIIIILIAALAAIGFISRFMGEGDTNSKENNQIVTEQDSCESFKTVASVYDNGDIDNCGCLENDSTVTKCQTDLANRNLYNQAVVETNLDLCNAINIEDMKKSCLKIVQSKIDYVDSRDNL